MRYSRLLKAEWIRLRRQPFLWMGVAVLLYLASNRWWSAYSLSASRPGFSLSHISGALYSGPYWLSYAFWQLPIDSLSIVLCLSAMGALWGMSDLNAPMVVEHFVRYRLFPMRLLLQRLGSLVVFTLLLQIAYGLLSFIFQIVIHGSVIPDLARAIPQITISALYDFLFMFGGFFFTYLWRQVAGGILTVAALWWFWSQVVELSIQNWYQFLPRWLSYVIMVIFPEPNVYALRYSASLWEQRLSGSGAFLPFETGGGTSLPGIPYGDNYTTGKLILYLPSHDVAILFMVLEAVLLLFLVGVAMRFWTSKVILKQYGMNRKALPLRRIILLTTASGMAGVFLWIYVISPILLNASSRQRTMQAEQIYVLAKTSSGIQNRTAVIKSPIGSVTIRDVYLDTLFNYNPSYVLDQAILKGMTSDAGVLNLLTDGYQDLRHDTEECASFAQIHPQAWKQIVSTSGAQSILDPGPAMTLPRAVVQALQSHGYERPQVAVLAQGVDAWIQNGLGKQMPGGTTRVINQRNQVFEQQLQQLIEQGSKLVRSVPVAPWQKVHA